MKKNRAAIKKAMRQGKNIHAGIMEHHSGPAAGKARSAISFFSRFSTLLSRYSVPVEIMILCLVLAVGFLVRMEDLRDWEAHPEKALYHGEPLLTTFDGYFYLSLARDLVEGKYGPVDYNRAVPDYPERPSPPPLLSVTAAGIVELTKLPMNWIGAVLPAALGILLAFPLYWLGRFYGGPVAGLAAALIGLLSHYYVYRSSLGWFDTDCMNVTWATGAAYFFLRFGIEQTRRRYLYLAGGLIIYGLFLWWWDQAPQVATAVALLPLAVALIFFYRPSRREGLAFAGLFALGVLAVLAWKGMDLPVRMVNDVADRFQYISKESGGDFPNIGLTISEQARPSFSEIIAKTTDSLPTFIVACAGLLLLFYRKPRESLFLSVPLILACLSFLFAKRFLIFLAPVTALGAGYLLSEIWYWRRRYSALAIFAPLLVLLLVWPAYSKDMSKTFWPKEPPHLVAGMVEAGKKTPENAVIWAWWDHGYPMIYFAQRGTINDGSVHSPERSIYNGLPFAVDDYRLAANFMQFYVSRGLSGMHLFYSAVDDNRARGFSLIKSIMAAGPEKARELVGQAGLKPTGKYKTVDEWMHFFYPGKTRPVYLFVDWRLTITSYWWFWLGTWDIREHDGVHPVYKAYYGLHRKEPSVYSNVQVSLDMNQGFLDMDKGRILLKYCMLNDGRKLKKKTYGRESGYNFEMFIPSAFGALEDDKIAESVFNRLYIRHVAPAQYFRPVILKSPSFQIWEVKGDRLEQS